MKRVLIVVLCICTLLLSSCTLYQEIVGGIDGATTFAEEFCISLADDNFDNAKSYLCSDYSAPSKEDFEKYIAKLEDFNKIDFSEGIKIINRSDNGWSGVNGNYAYEIVFETLVGEKEVNLFFVVVKSDNNYGIFSFGINPAQ